MAEQNNKLTICLIKPGIEDIDVIEDGCDEAAIPDLGIFYTKPSFAHRPDWVETFFKGTLPDEMKIQAASARGAFVTSIDMAGTTYTFALLFGQGRHLLRDDVIEERFGLKVVLNSVEPNSLRSIDKLNLGSFSKQSREQIGHEGDVANFGLDIEQDLVRAVTGRSKIAKFGKMISGKDSLSLSAKFDVGDIADLLGTCLTQFQSEEYKVNFDWIDQLKDVRSTTDIAALNQNLVDKIAAEEFDRIWMAPPEIVDWADVQGFKYAKPKRGELHDDLSIRDLVAAAEGKPITDEWLASTRIFVVSAKDDETHLHWPAFRCIYAEVMYGGSLHVLNIGKWYRVADDFTKSVNDDFDAVPDATIDVPAYSHAKEGDYNVALAAHIPNAFCLDADLIAHGGGMSKIEFCDVITADKKLIHVKRYSGSSQLSHLFSQGAVAAQIYMRDAVFREKVNDKLPPALKLANAQLRPNPADYEIIYAIISRSAKPLDIPFFSKVTMRNATQLLGGFGYRFSKLKIPVAAAA